MVWRCFSVMRWAVQGGTKQIWDVDQFESPPLPMAVRYGMDSAKILIAARVCSVTDFAARRMMMVDTQVRPSDVTKFPIIDAMLAVPREAFVPEGLGEAAYVGENLAIGGGRTMLDPRTLAKLLDALEIAKTDIVMDIACGLGYSTALLARMSEFVVGIESDEQLAARAQANLTTLGADNAVISHGLLSEGAEKSGPYDIIVLQGAVENVPASITDQLRDGGRIGAIFADGNLGVVKIGHKCGDAINWRYSFNASAPVLAGFKNAAAFSL